MMPCGVVTMRGSVAGQGGGGLDVGCSGTKNVRLMRVSACDCSSFHSIGNRAAEPSQFYSIMIIIICDQNSYFSPSH